MFFNPANAGGHLAPMLTNGGPPTLAPTLTNGGPPTENADTKRNSVKNLSEPESMPVDSYEFGGGQGGTLTVFFFYLIK